MPIEGLDEEGLPKNPDLQLAQWLFLLTVDGNMVDKPAVWGELKSAIKEHCKLDILYECVCVCVYE